MRISDWSSDVCSSDLLGDPGIGAVLSNWHDYRPDRPFDAIISVGAFEHFAHPQQSVEERRGVYREFFQACRDWMAGKGRLSLQTIAYGRMSPWRSEERRVGKECVSTCRSRVSPDH